MDTSVVATFYTAGQIQLSIFDILSRDCNSHGGKEQSEDCKKTHSVAWFLD